MEKKTSQTKRKMVLTKNSINKKSKTGLSSKTKRHRATVDPLQQITRPVLLRLARRGGVKRVSGIVYELVRKDAKAFTDSIAFSAATYASHARRKTLTCNDFANALKREGYTLYV